eukprot:TRINITY_DN32018_c0_g1_i1.p1 TRINITY_DN32018_c0_g1~~TRINITY_DN32018_c0_g1_i1.p1  ORF type:complete len:467 (+),score=109.82 TRINITY_DN32018_c0_g1_i1:112-1512(+)
MDSEDIELADLEEDGEGEEEEEEVLFFEDATGADAEMEPLEASPSASPQGKAEEIAEQETKEVLDEKTTTEVQDSTGEASESKEQELCTQCGLPGHSSANCPFSHPEDIELGDIEESDSDDELPDLYPLFSRYVASHVGALTPKDKRGLTGGGRYFGDDKNEGTCWACGLKDHTADQCPDKGCFFCNKKGHESRECPERAYRCSHCNLRGHAAVSCPTLVAQRIVSHTSVRCMRCNQLGHPNCGPNAQLMFAQKRLPSASSKSSLSPPSSPAASPPTEWSPPASPVSSLLGRGSPGPPFGNMTGSSPGVAVVSLRQRLMGVSNGFCPVATPPKSSVALRAQPKGSVAKGKASQPPHLNQGMLAPAMSKAAALNVAHSDSKVSIPPPWAKQNLAVAPPPTSSAKSGAKVSVATMKAASPMIAKPKKTIQKMNLPPPRLSKPAEIPEMPALHTSVMPDMTEMEPEVAD